MKRRLHVVIHGDVQGVFFRAGTVERANSLNLTGWVKNNSGGTVEAVFEGDSVSLKEILEFCKKGPSAATVRKAEKKWKEFKDEFEGFGVRY